MYPWVGHRIGIPTATLKSWCPHLAVVWFGESYWITGSHSLSSKVPVWGMDCWKGQIIWKYLAGSKTSQMLAVIITNYSSLFIFFFRTLHRKTYPTELLSLQSHFNCSCMHSFTDKFYCSYFSEILLSTPKIRFKEVCSIEKFLSSWLWLSVVCPI